MSYKIDTNNNNKDSLAEIFRKKLENHRTPIDTDSWGEIKKKIGGNNKSALWMIVSAISAAAIALLFILSPSDKTPIDIPLQGESTIIDNHNDEVLANDIALESQKESMANPLENNAIVTDSSEKDFVSPVRTVATLTSTAEEKEAGQTLEPNTTALKVEQQEEDSNANAKSDNIAVANASVSTETKKEQQKQTEAKQTYTSDFLFVLEEEIRTKKEKKNWTLAAAYNRGTNSNQSVNNSRILLQSSASNSTSLQKFNLLEQIKNWEGSHYPEMSFSLAVGKQLSKRFAIESGITYTYLYSKFDGTKNASGCEVKQHLHYLGIPVNVTAYLLNGNSNWNVYASGGVMLEKGIQASYKVDEVTVNEHQGVMDYQTATNLNESISGVQWSVNASVGASYDLSKSFTLFMAPRVSYYFDNNQPKSIRTTKDLSYGLNIGLKYNL